MKKLLLFLMVASCGPSTPEVGIYTTDPVVQIHVDTYLNYKQYHQGFRAANYHIEISFADLQPASRVGECTTVTRDHYGKKTTLKYIRIDIDAWDRNPTMWQENLIFHELGHCDLGLGHGGWDTIMGQNILSTSYYEAGREKLIEELFNMR